MGERYDGCGPFRPFSEREKGFAARKVAQDLISKWIFRSSELGSSCGNEVDADWILVGARLDPLIPSNSCKTLQSYLEKQLIACYREEFEDPRDAAPLVAELIRKSLKLAEETARYACSEIANVDTQ